MADTKISALTALSAPAGEDLLAIVDDPSGTPTSKKITLADLFGAYTATALSGFDADSALSISQTWNTTGAPTAIKLNVTDTASDAASLLFDFQTDSVSMASLSKDGDLAAAGKLTSGLSTGTALQLGPDGFARLSAIIGGTTISLNLSAYSSIGWCSGYASASPNITLHGDAADTLALRRFTNAQTLRVYGAYTDGSNGQWAELAAGASQIELSAETQGTGASNIDLALTPAGSGLVKYGSHSAIGAETVTGYIEIKDAGGVTRKLAVVS